MTELKESSTLGCFMVALIMVINVVLLFIGIKLIFNGAILFGLIIILVAWLLGKIIFWYTDTHH
jgi:hypothetical protein